MATQAIDNRNTLGAASVLIAVMCFSANDSSIKFLSGGYALHQIVFIRSLLALIVTMVFILPSSGGLGALRTHRLGMHLLRGLCVVIANMTYFIGLAVLPLANSVAVFFISPLVITTLSALILRERVGPRRWAAVALGMVGVVIMLHPGRGSFNVAMLFPLTAAVAYAFQQILVRKIGATESAATMAVYLQLIFVVVSASIGLALGHGNFSGQGGALFEFVLRGWVWPDRADYPILALIGLASAMGGYFIGQAYRLSEASVIAPMEYGALPGAVIFGMVIFGEWPDLYAWAGILLIVGSGLVVFWLESGHRDRSPSLAHRGFRH